MRAATSSPPWDSSATARALHAWTDADVRSIEQGLMLAMTAWAADWGLDDHAVPVQRVDEAATGAGWVRCRDVRDGAALYLHRAPDRAVAERAVFGAGSSPLGEQVLGACRRDLLQRLAAAFRVQAANEEPCAAPVVLSGRWTGVLVFRVGGDSTLVADAVAVRRFLGRPSGSTQATAGGALCHVVDAMATMPLTFTLELEACELPVASLLSLAPGDVVCLPHAIDAAARLRDADGRLCFLGHLRRRGAMRAITLCGLSPSSDAVHPPEDHHA